MFLLTQLSSPSSAFSESSVLITISAKKRVPHTSDCSHIVRVVLDRFLQHITLSLLSHHTTLLLLVTGHSLLGETKYK